jgi:hypothetical protein
MNALRIAAFLTAGALVGTTNIPTAHATLVNRTDVISSITAHDTNTGWLGWIAVAGMATAGNCPVTGNLVVLKIRNDEAGQRQYSMALAAYLAGRQVTASVETTSTVAEGAINYCVLRTLKLA